MLVLEETITDELTRRMFMFVPNKKAEFYTSLEGMFPETWKAFPDMRDDIAGACKCYAMNQNTACVFHCMGVAQGGLHTLAKDLQVSFPFPVDLAEWKNVIDKIEAEIRKLEQLPKGQIKDEKLKFYS
jgi:hypothetical protein